jgi:hypothetical protein
METTKDYITPLRAPVFSGGVSFLFYVRDCPFSARKGAFFVPAQDANVSDRKDAHRRNRKPESAATRRQLYSFSQIYILKRI